MQILLPVPITQSDNGDAMLTIAQNTKHLLQLNIDVLVLEDYTWIRLMKIDQPKILQI